jgi:hypothetical protein
MRERLLPIHFETGSDDLLNCSLGAGDSQTFLPPTDDVRDGFAPSCWLGRYGLRGGSSGPIRTQVLRSKAVGSS